MALAVYLPLPPMEAKSVDAIPEGGQWQYEPKWDGFRCLASRGGAGIELQSKAEQPLTRYFPELVAALSALDAPDFLLDGEIAIPSDDGGFSFDALLQRIHPAASRVKRLAAETPAILIFFDLLAGADGESLVDLPLATRRPQLEKFAARYFHGHSSVRLSPATASLTEARKWLAQTGATMDGIIAKRLDRPYQPGERGDAMQKIKNYRSADCVVGGFRYGTGKKVVGSLLLGLYDDAGLLHHVGFTSGLSTAEKAALTKRLQALVQAPGFTGRAPGGPSRWSQGKSNEWQPLRPELVVEVCYDHVTGGRFRHGTRLLRWRPDKAPARCTVDQLAQKSASLLKLLR